MVPGDTVPSPGASGADPEEQLCALLRLSDQGVAITPQLLEREWPDAHPKVRQALRLAGLLERGRRGPVRRVGPYRLLGKLGRGGMATVHLAVVERRVAGLRRGETVALKVIHPQLLSETDVVDCFLREARLGRGIVHENVVRTLDAGVVGKGERQAYLAMEYVEGQTLRQLRAELGGVPEQLCRHVAVAVARALAAIHGAGVIHRDVKPDNVLVTRDERVKLMDLGIAQLVEEAGRLSRSGTFVGSFLYAAPEQVEGVALDGRTDLYSLGLTLLELASGSRRWSKRSTSHLSPFFAEMLRRLLATDPAARFASAAELVKVLEAGESSSWWRDLRNAARVPRRRTRRDPPLCGRKKEIARLRALLAEAGRGRGRIVLLEGEEGIGKSRLARELVDRAGPRVDALEGAFGPAAGGAATAFLAALRLHVDGDELGGDAVATALSDSTPLEARGLGLDALSAAIVRALRASTRERPAVCVIEDLHFAPPEGLALFASVATAIRDERILLAGTTRHGLPQAWVDGLARLEHASRIRLARLSRPDLKTLLERASRERSIPPRLVQRVATLADGNPFFALEILRSLRGDDLAQLEDAPLIPPSLRDTLAARIDALAEQERELLDVAACHGVQFDPTVVADALGEPRIPALRRFAGLEHQHRLIRSAGRDFVFEHHLVQEVLRLQLPPRLAEAYHAALGATLERRHAEQGLSGAAAAEACQHYLAGGRGDDGLRLLDAALEHHDATYGHRAAVALVDLALAARVELSPQRRAALLLRKADDVALLGDREAEDAAAREAAELADSVGDARLRALARVHLATCLYVRGRSEEARRLSEEALRLAREGHDPRGMARATGLLANLSYLAGRMEHARARFEKLLELAREADDRHGEASALALLGRIEARRSPSRARGFLRRAQRLAVAAGDVPAEVRSALLRGALALKQGLFGVAQALFERGLALTQESGNRSMESLAVGCLGTLAEARGHLAEALSRHEWKLQACREVGTRATVAETHASLARTYYLLGDPVRARSHAEEGLQLTSDIGVALVRGDAQATLGYLAWDRSDLAGAERLFRAAWDADERLHLAEFLAETGRPVEARRRLEDVLRDEGRSRPELGIPSALRLALLSGVGADLAVRRFEGRERRLSLTGRMRARLLAFRLTGEAGHIDEAHRLLHELRTRAPKRRRQAILENVGMHRLVEVAHEGA